MNRKARAATLALALLLSAGLGGCGQSGSHESSPPASETSQTGSSSSESSTEESGSSGAAEQADTVTITDSAGKTVEVPTEPKVISLYGSYADAWILAGGELIGVTEDAVEERELDVGEAQIVGTVKEPNAETIISLEPDLVLLSSDIAAQQDMLPLLEQAGLSCVSYRVDTFEDYSAMMTQFCNITGRADLFDKNVVQVGNQIDRERERANVVTVEEPPKILLMRAFSTGIKAKTDDELAGAILKDLGCHNIADDHPSMLEDLSLEEVIAAQPDYIFVTTMGDESKALAYLDSQIAENPAWTELDAVKNGRYKVLPKELFHYKPNAKWGESYAYLGACLNEKD